MCRYRLGDAISNLVVMTTLASIFIVKFIEEQNPWYLIGSGILLLTFIGCSMLNFKEREKEDIKRARDEHQLSLGVPPEEL